MTQMIHTPQSKTIQLKQFLKATMRPDERDRARAILELIEGKRRKEVADFFDITLTTLGEWQQKFKKYGAEGLRTKPQQGNRYKLRGKQKEDIKRVINKQTPSELGFHGAFWTVPLLRAYVKQAYSVSYKSNKHVS
jgi:transposase